MKLSDVFRISFHSIFNNKIRTLITIVIVFIVSLLIMSISIIGLSFYYSINSAYVNLYDLTGATFKMEQYSFNTESENIWRGINEAEYDIVMNEFSNSPELVDNVIINDNGVQSFYFYDLDEKPTKNELDTIYQSHGFYEKYSNLSPNIGIFSSWGDLDTKSRGISYLKSGKLWNREDEGVNKIWVSEAFIAKAASLGKYLDVGDYVVVSFVSWINKGEEYNEIRNVERFKISGIFLNSALDKLNYDDEIFIEIKTLYKIMGDNFNVNSFTVISEPKFSYIFEDEYKKMSTIVKNVNEQVEPNSYNNKEYERFECNLVENLKMVRIIGGVMIGASIFVCFIILIISIGSVANSVIISVDKNKKFLGVMMAVGLKNGGVKKIVEYEALMIIILATGLAYGVLCLLQVYFKPIIDFLMTLPGFTDSTIIVMPIYIPIATVLAFIAMALLFARKSLNKIINMDVISVISEVA